ncbi:MAG: ferritin-like domain-containing protein [Blastocatellia bacterium]|nr:ferritin-like domain-containing protein [Blastocatellia bacterium]
MSANKKNFFEMLDVKSRRDFFKAAALAGISGAALVSLSPSVSADDKENDVKILNIALGLEHQAIAAYKAGAGLLSGDVLNVAVKFLKQHEEHRDGLAATVKKLGGKPEEAKSSYDVAKIAEGVGVKELKAATDVLKLAAKLEAQATSAYYGVLPKIADRNIAQVAASIMADEAIHTALLRSALGEDPAPTAFVK